MRFKENSLPKKPISHLLLDYSRDIGFSREIYRGIHRELGSNRKQPKRGQFQNLLFSLTLQPVRINNPGAPLLALAKSISYV